MRSLNVKKVAAAAAGMAFLGAALATAATVNVDTAGLGSFPFFSNGEPSVKVVVGQRAAASDAVAAGNIAAMLGNLAYKDQAVTVEGLSGLTCGSGSTGGSCDLSNKKVVLTITTPGVNPASAFQMKTYVEDNLDYNPDVIRGTTTSFGSLATGFAANTGPKVINKDLTAVLSPHPDLSSDGKINYNGKGSTNTKEEQNVYAFAYTSYDSTAKKLMGKNAKVGYEAVFTDPVPICLDTTKAAPACADADLVTKNNVRVTFLGDKWSIMDYAISSNVVNQVTLGKEIQHKDIMRVGDSATTADGFTIVMTDLSGFGYGSSNLPRVSFDIQDKNGNIVKQITLDEGQGSLTISEANNLVVKVNKAFPGAFAKVAYADVSLFANKLDLINNQEVSGISGGAKNWKVIITTANVSSTQAFSKIQLYNDVDQQYKSPISQDLAPGESIDLIHNMAGLKFNYLGLDTVDYDPLTITVQKDQNLPYYDYQLTNQGFVHAAKGDWLLISSGKSNAFQLGKNVGSIYVLASSTNTSVPLVKGQVLYYDDILGYYISNATSGANASAFAPVSLPGGVNYWYTTSESANLTANMTNFSFASTTGNGNHSMIFIPEITEDANGTTAQVGATNRVGGSNFHWNVQYDPNLRQFVNTMGSTTVDKIGYDDKGMNVTNSTMDIASKDPGYVSRRGGIFNSISSSSVSFSYPLQLAHATYTLTKAGTAAAANQGDYTLAEGDSQDLGNGYKVTVKSIMADAATGSSGNGTTGSSGIDTSGVKPSVEKAAVVNPLQGDLVVFDNEAGNTANLIVVGGPAANALADAATVPLTAGSSPVIKVAGGKVYVAGYTAADTQTAAAQLISWLNSNRDAVRG